MTEIKMCVRCKINKSTAEYYYDITRSKLKSACKECCRVREAEFKRGIIRPKAVIAHKRCNMCKEVKPVADFYIKYGYYLSLCKKCFAKYTAKYNIKYIKKNMKNQWFRTYYAILSRCSPKSKYGKRGIQANITLAELKKLWHRDRGWLLKRPSIDRIYTKGNYTFENCRYIELSENCKRKKGVYQDG